VSRARKGQQVIIKKGKRKPNAKTMTNGDKRHVDVVAREKGINSATGINRLVGGRTMGVGETGKRGRRKGRWVKKPQRRR